MALWGYSTFWVDFNQKYFMPHKILFKKTTFFQALLIDSATKSSILRAQRRETVVLTPLVRDGFSALSSEWPDLSFGEDAKISHIPLSLSHLSEMFCVDCYCAPIWQPSRALVSCRGNSPVWPSSIRTDTWTAGEPGVKKGKIKVECSWLVQQGCRSFLHSSRNSLISHFIWYNLQVKGRLQRWTPPPQLFHQQQPKALLWGSMDHCFHVIDANSEPVLIHLVRQRNLTFLFLANN